MRPKVYKNYLCLITMLRSPPKRGVCTLPGTISALHRGAQCIAYALAVSTNIVSALLCGKKNKEYLLFSEATFINYLG